MKVERLISGKLSNNTFIVFDDEKKNCFMIDAAANLEDVKNLIGEAKLLAVFLTHGHFDHVENLDSIINFYKVPCYIYKTELQKLYKPLLNYCRVFYTSYTTTLTEDKFCLLDNDQLVELENFSVLAVLTKGHTDGSVCYYVNNDLLFTGDTLFFEGYGRTDLLTGSTEDMEESLEILSKRFSGKEFYSGHGENGFVG